MSCVTPHDRAPGTPARPAGPLLRLRQRFLVLVMTRFGAHHEKLVAARKQRLFAGLHGRVLEVGPGTGVNLRHYPRGTIWIGVEPNPYMHPHLRAEAARFDLPIDLRRGVAESLPADDASVEAVVATLVLCSVNGVDAALAEIRRVLVPGGQFVFLEHVASPPGTRLRRLQNLATPLTRCLGEGCHLNRETWKSIGRAGFSRVDLEHFRVPMRFNGPHIAGCCVR